MNLPGDVGSARPSSSGIPFSGTPHRIPPVSNSGGDFVRSGGSESAPSGPLEDVCGICSPLPEENPKIEADLRLGRMALQAVAREWLWSREDGLKGPWHRLAGCTRWMATRTVDGQAQRCEFVELWHDPGKMRAYYKGLQTCGSAWADPVCSGVIYDTRKTEIDAALTWARENGYKVFFVTLTAAHKKVDDLASLLDALGSAMRLVYRGSPWVRFRDKFGYLGSIRGTEITYGRHGWHPHFHLLWFSKTGTAGEIAEYADPAWRSALARQGLHGLKGVAVKVKDSSWTAAEYMAKFGADRPWDLDAEMTMWARKNGEKGYKGATPWDLLRAGLRAIPSDVQGTPGEAVYRQVVANCRHLFREYAFATKGKHSMRWSSGLAELAGVKVKSDEEIAAGESNERELFLLARLTVEQWRVVCFSDMRGELRAIAGRGDYGLVVDFLAELGVVLPPAEVGVAAAAG